MTNVLKWHGLDVDPMKINESATIKPTVSQVDTAFNESTNESGITVLYPKIEAIHEGATRNGNRYTAEKLKGNYDLRSGVYSWTQPYPKPVIFNHDHETRATGRVHSASYSDYTQKGVPGLIVTPKITDAQAIKDVLDGLLLTVSIGATTNAAVCSVCGTDIINEGYCGHMRGETYEGQTCEWICGDLYFDELSWVNVPADASAMVISNGLTTHALPQSESAIVIGQKVEPHIDPSVSTAGSEDAGTIVAGTLSADDIINTNTTLTDNPEVVTSVSESTKKEETATVENPIVEEQPIDNEPTVPENMEPEVKDETTPEVQPIEEPIVPEDKPEDHTEPEAVDEELLKAQDSLKTAEQENADLKEANIQMAKELHDAHVGFLVDLRILAGKETNREEAVQSYEARTIESLRDSIQDLLSEKPSVQTSRQVEFVDNPAAANTNSKTLASTKEQVISNEEVLIRLMSGK